MTPDASNRAVQSARDPLGGAKTPTLQDAIMPLVSAVPIVPDHELLKKIGGGSYGEVWLAKNKLGTYRAVKIVYRRTFEDIRPFEREFKGIQKFEPISRSHEGLVDILQVGGTEDYFYYVMELADDASESPKPEIRDPKQIRIPNAESSASGQLVRDSDLGVASGFGIRNWDFYVPLTLGTELRRRGRLPVNECIEIGLALTSALEHLHRHKLVHRDLKPHNIIFVGGLPKLADIGLVAEVSEARSYVGTEGFIPPEGPGTVRADLYSLGKLLYEISTGKDRHAFPELPSDLHQQSEAKQLVELNAILLKVCQPDPRKRHSSAAEMHSELAQIRTGKSIRRKRAMQEQLSLAKKIAFAAAVLTLIAISARVVWSSFSSRVRSTSTHSLQKPLTTNLDALNAYSQGLYAYNKNADADMANAILCFEQAIALDPNFAEAYAGLASSYAWLDFPENLAKARTPAEKALALNPNLPEAHKNLASLRYLLDWQWAEADQEFKLAIQLDPRDGEALRAYGLYLRAMGLTREAIAVLTHAHEIDPRSISTTRVLGSAFFAAGDYQAAMKQYQSWLQMETNSPVARWDTAQIHQEQGLFLKAIDLLQEEFVLLGENTNRVAGRCAALRKAYNDGGAEGYWQKSLEFAKEDPTTTHYDLAKAYARVGDLESVSKYLQLAAQNHDPVLVLFLKTDRAFDKFRREPEYGALLRSMKWEK